MLWKSIDKFLTSTIFPSRVTGKRCSFSDPEEQRNARQLRRYRKRDERGQRDIVENAHQRAAQEQPGWRKAILRYITVMGSMLSITHRVRCNKKASTSACVLVEAISLSTGGEPHPLSIAQHSTTWRPKAQKSPIPRQQSSGRADAGGGRRRDHGPATLRASGLRPPGRRDLHVAPGARDPNWGSDLARRQPPWLAGALPHQPGAGCYSGPQLCLARRREGSS